MGRKRRKLHKLKTIFEMELKYYKRRFGKFEPAAIEEQKEDAPLEEALRSMVKIMCHSTVLISFEIYRSFKEKLKEDKQNH